MLSRNKMNRRRITVQQKTRPEVSEVNSIMRAIQEKIQLSITPDCIFSADETGVNYAAGVLCDGSQSCIGINSSYWQVATTASLWWAPIV